MLLWSLGQSIITPTARVPSIYFADEETDKKLKEITPCKDGRYLPDASSPEQTQKQLKILEGFAASKGLKFLEVDNYNRLRCILTSTECIIRYFLKQRWIEGLPNFCFVALAVILCAIFAYYPLGQLLIYHVKLASLNETTCEQAKPPNIRGDVKADYNMGTYRNLRAAFGWGLWLFPVSTHVNDGLHFPVRYTEASNGIKYCTINVKESTE
ncbi:unnamed protein product [Toxocara canis]|uniref:Uncharacterized protein n=1 Tax=Toxocara canis TaxID=6265 RepID=A0A183UBB3_TOXCA|nr:unnamed protein product [Toxocara canis]